MLAGVLILVSRLLVATGLLHLAHQARSASEPAGPAVDTGVATATAKLHDALSDGSLTEDELHAIDLTDLWYASFRTELQKPIVGSTQEEVTLDSHDENGVAQRVVSRERLTFDLRTKAFARERNTHQYSGGTLSLVERDRCVGGRSYTSDTVTGRPREPWKPNKLQYNQCTELAPEDTGYISDSIATGGLTAKQADVMVGELRKEDKFLRTRQAKLVMHGAKQYIRFAVEVTPVGDHNDEGSGRFGKAFAKTGLDADKYPYRYYNYADEGLRFITYVDPATLLPAYSEFADTPPLDAYTGRQQELEDGQAWELRVAYSFPGRIEPLDLKDYTDVPMSWPAEPYPPHTGDWNP